MIQIKRGRTSSWRKTKDKLASGQLGYDKDKHKIKVGDGTSLWTDLPYASGLSAKEILDSEKDAKIRCTLDKEDTTLITYGPDGPDSSTVGKLYLQTYSAEPEVDYVVDDGISGIWRYRKWKSGKAECCGTIELSTAVQSAFEGISLYINNTALERVSYPITFIAAPDESASLRTTAAVAWLAGRSNNTNSHSAIYSIISTDKLNNSTFYITLRVEGRWR